jgi:CBS-domain-containing membrane protein
MSLRTAAASHAAHEPWQRSIREVPSVVHLAPSVCHPDDALPAIVETFAREQGAGMVFVVDDEDRLLGSIRERALDADLVTMALPEQLWSRVRGMSPRAVLRAARGQQRARDLMSAAHSVTADDTLEHAIAQMANSEDSAIALVDEQRRLLGYVRLFDVLSHLLRAQVASAGASRD